MCNMFVTVNNNDMNTKVRKKGSKRERVPTRTTKVWLKVKAEKEYTYFDLMNLTGLSELTIRNALQGLADSDVVKKLNDVLNQEAAA